MGTITPIDQKWDEAVAQPHVGIRQAPREDPAASRLAPTDPHLAERNPGVTSRCRAPLQVRGLGGPADQAWCRERIESEPARPRRRWLGGIGADELEVHRGAKTEQRVPGAFTWMPASRYRSHAGPALETLDLGVEIQSAPDQVIDGRQAIRLRRGSVLLRSRQDHRSSSWYVEWHDTQFAVMRSSRATRLSRESPF